MRPAHSDAENDEDENDSDDEIFFGPSTIREECARTINGAGTPVRKAAPAAVTATGPAHAAPEEDSDDEEEIFFGDAGSARECAQKLAAVRQEVESCLRGDGEAAAASAGRLATHITARSVSLLNFFFPPSSLFLSLSLSLSSQAQKKSGATGRAAH